MVQPNAALLSMPLGYFRGALLVSIRHAPLHGGLSLPVNLGLYLYLAFAGVGARDYDGLKSFCGGARFTWARSCRESSKTDGAAA